jgi:hypothetical protein
MLPGRRVARREADLGDELDGSPFAYAELMHAPIHAPTLQRPPHDTSSPDGEDIYALLRKQLDLKSPATGF